MSHYLDIQLLSDPEFPTHQLLSALYAKLHRALSSIENKHIAVCFPGYDLRARHLGNCLRLVSAPDELSTLMSSNWLTGMRDHVRLVGPMTVPIEAVPRTLRRVQAKSSPHRLRRRQMKRHGLTEAEAAIAVPLSTREQLWLPNIQIRSGSSGQTFRLFFRLGPPEAVAVTGSFNAYGLSTSATIPCF